MKEIEVKILNIDRRKTERLVVSLGAKKVFDDEIITVLFDYPDSSIKKANNLIRLRKSKNKSYVTFKKYIENAQVKERQEYEVEVSDFTTMYTIFTSLGLCPELYIKKHRVSYILDHVRFEFDKHVEEYGFIPEFLEVEAKDEATLSTYIQKLGFSKNQCKSWSFSEVADYYKTK